MSTIQLPFSRRSIGLIINRFVSVVCVCSLICLRATTFTIKNKRMTVKVDGSLDLFGARFRVGCFCIWFPNSCHWKISLFQIVPVLLSVIRKISAVRLYLPSDLRSRDNRQSVLKSIQEVERRFPDGVPLLDPIQDMGIKDPQLKEIVQKIEAFEHR